MSNTILIVEDNVLNMKLFVDVLENSGYKTVQSVDGKNILKLAREHAPGLIIMDIQLPETSGLDLTKMLKAEDDLKDIPVLAVTAFSLEGGIEAVFAAGCDDIIAKPLNVSDFLEAVDRYS